MTWPVDLSVTWTVNCGLAMSLGSSAVAATSMAGTTNRAMLTGHDSPLQRVRCRIGESIDKRSVPRRELGTTAARSKRIGEDFECILTPKRVPTVSVGQWISGFVTH